jgi:hypothetical protein
MPIIPFPPLSDGRPSCIVRPGQAIVARAGKRCDLANGYTMSIAAFDVRTEEPHDGTQGISGESIGTRRPGLPQLDVAEIDIQTRLEKTRWIVIA